MRTLVLNLGNTTLFGGVFVNARLIRCFRVPIGEAATAGGLASLATRHWRGSFDAAALCSVVPALTETTVSQVARTCGVAPRVLTADAAHGLAIGYRRSNELGADRIAAALGARSLWPKRDVIVVDCGTATTVTALHRDGTILGGAILPGLALWPEMLAARTAQLPRIELKCPGSALGRTPVEAIASGIFHGHAGAIRELVQRISAEAFGKKKALVIGTGGLAPQFSREKLFTEIVPDLILYGLRVFAAQIHSHA